MKPTYRINLHPYYVGFWWLAWMAGLAALVVECVRWSQGQLIYSLDDPYIHLSVARNILRGGYGVNLQEFSSPSSSILYPFLLAPTLALGMGTYGPLLINIIAMGFSVWLLLDFLWRRIGETRQQQIFAWLLAPLFILSINAVALPLTGMEHSLHVLCAILAMRGLIELLEKNRVTPSLTLSTAFMPLIRFEGLALACAIVFVLLITGHRRAAATISLFLAVALGAWGLFMHHLGLPFLPDSVLLKSTLADTTATHVGAAALIFNILHHIHISLQIVRGCVFILAITILTISIFFFMRKEARSDKLRSPKVLMAFVVIFTLGAHVIGGRYGAGDRYEIYAMAVLMMATVYYLAPLYARATQTKHIIPFAIFTISLMLLDNHYFTGTLITHRACRNIYEQQYQMHRFATEFFPRRVAVDDLGWVSYGNDAFVFDLVGLGSDRMRKILLEQKPTADILSNAVNDADVDYAMIYDIWTGNNVPSTWCKLAVMRTEIVSAGGRDVAFYAIKSSVIPAMNKALDRFITTIPARDVMVRSACQPITEEDFRRAYIRRLMGGR